MRVELAGGEIIQLGATETAPTIGITDYSRRVTDDFGVTTIVERGFARRLSVRLALPFDEADGLQRRLAALRATSALWVAGESLDWLSVTGFYKGFEIDLAVPPLSYCTLEVEGLAAAEPFADPGTDPAPDGRPSTLQLLRPATVNDAALAYSSVAENDHPEWSAGTTYSPGARVIRAATHRIYESLAAANIGNDPAGSSGKWLDVGPTSRWAMFDQALGTVTHSAAGIVVVLSAGTINAVALLDVVADAVRVEAPGYDRYATPDGGALTFLDMPTTAGLVTVTIAGADPVSIGTLLIGSVAGLGITEAAPTAGITDYSRKEVDDFGEVTVVPRAWAKRMATRALIRTDAVDIVANRIAAVRARPSLWIGQAGLDSLTVYGFFKDFSIEVRENVSTLSLSIEGLSTASPVVPVPGIDQVTWPTLPDPDGTKPENGATKGAPPGTYVGGTLAEEIEAKLQTIDEQVTGILDTTPPGVPTGLAIYSALTDDGTVDLTLSWNAVADLDVATYHLDVSLGGGGFVRFNAPGTTYVLHGIQPNALVQARVRAVDKLGNASNFSATLNGTTTRDTVAPAAPTNFYVEPAWRSVMLFWQSPPDKDLSHVVIHESGVNDFSTSYTIGTANATPGGYNSFVRDGLPSGVKAYYWFQAVDTSGNGSSFAGPVEAQLQTVDNADLSPQLVIPGDVPSLPNPVGYTGPRVIVNRADEGKLYRLVTIDGVPTWTKEVSGLDIASDTLTASHLKSATLTSREIKAYAITASRLGIVAENLFPWGSFLDGTLDSLTRVVLGGDGNNVIRIADGFGDPNWPSRFAMQMFCKEQTNTAEISISTGLFEEDDEQLQGFQTKLDDEYLFQCTTFANNGALPKISFIVRFPDGTLAGHDVVLEPGFFVKQSLAIKNTYGEGKAYFRFWLDNSSLTAGDAYVYWWNLYCRQRATAELLVDGIIKARHVVAETFNGDVIKANTLTGDRFSTTTSLPGSITIGETGVSIETVRTKAQQATDAINSIADDNIISKGEKGALIQQWDAVDNETAIITAQAVAQGFGDSAEKYAWDGARDYLAAYLTSLTPAWNDGNYDTPVDGFTLRQRFTNYYNKRWLLLSRLTQYAQELAEDPAPRINANSTLIAPGKIQLTGSTTLRSILYGGDETKIDGGVIAANTVRANSVVIGMRGIQPIDISFTADPATNIISWTAGYIEWQNEAGARQVTPIPAGSAQYDTGDPIAVLYVWWDRTTTQLWAGMVDTATILANTNNVLMAVYRGGTNQIVFWGRTIIDGAYIKTGTVDADRLIVNSIDGKYLKVDAISARELGADAVTTRNLKADTIQAKHFITDQGVDLAAIVPGSLNWRSSAGHGSLPFIGPDQGSGIVASTGVGKCYPGTDLSFGDVEVSWVGGGTSAGDVVDLTVAFAYRIDGGAWVGTGQAKTIRYSVGSYTTLADTTGKSFYLPAVEGLLQLGVLYGVVTSNGFGNTPTGGANIASGSFSAKIVNWK